VTLGELGERGLIDRIRRRLGPPAAGVRLGIGDDAAVIAWPAGDLLLTVDTLLEDVHFRRSTSTLRDVGAKAMAVNLSDVAAMGGTPRVALVALAIPQSSAVSDIDELYTGLLDLATPHGVTLVGGDTCSSPVGVVLTVTLAGRLDGPPLTRSGARPGDLVLVTGSLGAAAAGLASLEPGPVEAPEEALAIVRQAHHRPTPRVQEGRAIRTAGGATAMIDLSDGLATDLGHIARESGAGAVVDLDALPIAEATRTVARAAGADPRVWAVSGGEDYELCFTAPPEAARILAARVSRETGTAVSVVGRIETAPAGVTFVDHAGRPVAMRPGFDHFA
jgi:thiamine-monophosphate kinase